MSSEDEETSRKRRVQRRACDACRRRKIRCEFSQESDGRCLYCAKLDIICSSHDEPRSRAPPSEYVEYLESRLDQMEVWMRKHYPDVNFGQEFGPRYDRRSWRRDGAVRSQMGSASARPLHTTLPTRVPKLDEAHEGELDSSGDETTTGVRSLEAHLHTLRLNPMRIRYVGKSSGASLIESALAAKQKLSGTPSDALPREAIYHTASALVGRRPEFWEPFEWETTQSATSKRQTIPASEVPPTSAGLHAADGLSVIAEFWEPSKSVVTDRQPIPVSAAPPSSAGLPATGGLSVLAVGQVPTKFTFPPMDLMPTLIDAYFTCLNTTLPVLHRPSFERAFAEGTHQHDSGFGAVLLLVCALGARFINDERVLLDNGQLYSAGWKWFNQVYMMQRSLLTLPSIYDVQVCCLTAMFLHTSCALWQSAWSVVGVGIRLALDVGAHRNKMYSETPTVHDELWRRAFWVLVVLDRQTSSIGGRPCAIQDEDFDLDLPADCDDEYWENDDPTLAFKQPPRKPSKIGFLISLIKLTQIHASSLRTIHAINKSKILLGFVGPEWEQRIVSELDSAMNQWIDSIPEHLRWDPNRDDATFFDQSAALYTAYYQLQINIHKPFINARRNSTTNFPSLAICTHAARACAKVTHAHIARLNRTSSNEITAAFTSGVVLLLSIWDSRRSSATFDPTREMADVYKCLDVLKAGETRWQYAGRMWDVLAHLASVSDLPLRKSAPGTAQKRSREPREESAGLHVPLAPAVAPQEYLNMATMPVPIHAAGASFRQHTPTSASNGPPTLMTSPPMSAPGLSASDSVPSTGWPHASEHIALPDSIAGFDIIANATLHSSTMSTNALGDSAEQLTAWWALQDQGTADQAVGGGHPSLPAGTSTVDVDAFGAALDALLCPYSANSVDGHVMDPFVPWAQMPSEFGSEDWSRYLNDMPGGEAP